MKTTNTRTRYVARWMSEQFYDATNDCGDPDKDKYKAKAFASRDEAGKYGCEQNCYGSECRVEVDEWGIDQDFLEETGIVRYVWNEVEEWLCQEGDVFERIYPE